MAQSENTRAYGGSWVGAQVSVLTLLVVLSAVFLMDDRARAQASQPEREMVPNAEPGQDFQYLGMFLSENDLKERRSVCQRARALLQPSYQPAVRENQDRPSKCDHIIDIIAGKAYDTNANSMQQPAKVTTDSRQRVIVTDPLAAKVHIFDFVNRKYSYIATPDGSLRVPLGVAVDASDNIYVTDAARGMILVFSPGGRLERFIGDGKGEGLFEQPTGIAIDKKRGRIYVADSARHIVLMFDIRGNPLGQVGARDGQMAGKFGTREGGSGPGEFKFPSDLAINDEELAVLDTANSRIQMFDLGGQFKGEFLVRGVEQSPVRTGIALDQQDRVYLVGSTDSVQVFDANGRPLYSFGTSGEGNGQFSGPAGIWADSNNRVFIADSGNRRVQVFSTRRVPSLSPEK
jgi:DNA-binding beta-propeller fold protein YncE